MTSQFEQFESRLSFRKRLLFFLGPWLGIVLALLGGVAWLFAYSWLTYTAQTILDIEISEIANQIVDAEGNVNAGAYNWNEPHHRYDTQHIDPYFLQVFDGTGKILRASDNITLFTSNAYPMRLLAYQTGEEGLIERLRTFSVGEKTLYYRTRTFHDLQGNLLGYIQVARYDPGISAIMWRTSLAIIVSLVTLFAMLLGIVWWNARRVVSPLEQITRQASRLSPVQLNQRINVPVGADSETVILGNTLNDLLARLEKAFVEVQQFTADAAHELQTPLTVIKGHIDVALRRDRSPEKYKETLQVLREQTATLINLVHNLLHLARNEQSKQLLDSTPVDLVSIVKEVSEDFANEIQAKGLSYEKNLPTEAWMEGNTIFVREIVSNVIENAIKYTHEGTITVSLLKSDGHLRLTVQDTGIGMTDEVVQRVTDRFYRAPTASVQNTAGNGLGMALVQQLVHMHDGTLHIESSPGSGTCVAAVFKST